MVRIAVVFLVAVFLVPPTARTETGTPEPLTSAQAQRVSQLVKQLGSNSYKRREQAHKSLIQMGRPVLSTLRKLRSAAQEPEVGRRLREIVDYLAVHADPHSKGLAGAITADRQTLTAGQVLRLEVTLLNTTHQTLQLGTALGPGEVIERQQRLRIRSSWPEEGKWVEVKMGSSKVCGPGTGLVASALGSMQRRWVIYTISSAVAQGGMIRLTVRTGRPNRGNHPIDFYVKPGTLEISYLLTRNIRRPRGSLQWNGTLRRTVLVKLDLPGK